MIITMQGDWTVSVKSKKAAFPQRFIISGAATKNGTYDGVTTTAAVPVTGSQWTIAIQHNPGSGFQLSDSKVVFPHQVGGNYEFDIQSNDSGTDQDFDDLILTCSAPAGGNDFLVYGNLSLYSGGCALNPCRKDLFVLETPYALQSALRNPSLRNVLEEYYPERISAFKIDPNPPDPRAFKPFAIDLYGEAMQSKTWANVTRLEDAAAALRPTGKETSITESVSPANFRVTESIAERRVVSDTFISRNRLDIAKAIDGLVLGRICTQEPGSRITLTFEEYDRTNAEQAGGPYTGTGNRRLLGDTITDMFGNYIFRYSFDMIFPEIEDDTDSFPGETPGTYAYPDLIIKVTGIASWDVLWESVPYFNVRNRKRINLCVPRSIMGPRSSCANGNLIGSLGNVFIGGNQNTAASTEDADLVRDGNYNYLGKTGVVSVHSGLAGFQADCASWGGMIDIFGCIYDVTKTLSDNKIRWYTIRIKREGSPNWTYVTEPYKHPLLSKHSLAGYTGDKVGPFPTTIQSQPNIPAYKNIRAEQKTGAPGTDWVDSHIDRLMQLNTDLYDIVEGVHTPGTFYLRIDGYDAGGTLVTGKTDMIALYIHNKAINFALIGPELGEPSIVNAGCGLYRLTDAQNNVPMKFSFMANDPDGFIDSYSLTMSRCPKPTIALQAGPSPMDKIPVTPENPAVLSAGVSTSVSPDCGLYTGTLVEFTTPGLIAGTLQPDTSAGEVGWIKQGEYFTIYTFTLSAAKRVTNGYLHGVSGAGPISTQIMMEKINPKP